MTTLNLPNQIMTLLQLLCYTPYMVYWMVAFMLNMFWLSCMFHILYKSNIYMLINNRKYIGCAVNACIQMLYLYGVLTWNPIIICMLMGHSFIIENTYITTYQRIINDLFADAQIRIEYPYPEQDVAHVDEPEQDVAHVDEPEQDVVGEEALKAIYDEMNGNVN